MLKLFSIFIGCFFLLGCKDESVEEKNAITFEDFPERQSIVFRDHMQLDTSVGCEKLYVMDTSLIVANLNKIVKNYLFFEYSLNSKKLIGKYIKWGTGKNMVYGTISNGIHKNKLWAHDVSLEKIVIASLGSKCGFDSLSEVKEYSLPGFMYSVQLVDSNKLFQSGMYSIVEYLQKWNLTDSLAEARYFEYIPPNKKHPVNTWKSAYESFLFVHPNERVISLASRYADRVMFFNIDSNNYKVVRGPLNFRPEFEANASYATKYYGITRTLKTRFAFLGGTATAKNLYLLFSGRNESEDNFYRSNKVFVYDWSGKPVKVIELDRYVETIAISRGDDRIYSIDYKTKKMLTAPLIH